MLGRSPLPLLGPLPLAVVAVAGCGADAPAGAQVAPRSQPQGAYGGGY
jgi:hypothetical protein